MKRALILAAAGVVLAANAWALFSAARNRRDAPGGTVDLSERELSLPRESGESTALFLEIEWGAAGASPERGGSPPWLDAVKLAELGFDCQAAPANPRAIERDRSRPSRPAFLVLDCRGGGWQPGRSDRAGNTRLLAVDAGLDPRLLRKKYTDPARYIIARGLVRAAFREKDDSPGTSVPQPRWQGWITELLPGQIFVPRPHSAALAGLPRRPGRDRAETNQEPRYTVTVSWGQHYEPWIIGMRMRGGR